MLIIELILRMFLTALALLFIVALVLAPVMVAYAMNKIILGVI